MPIQSWQARGRENKKIVAKRKKSIQEAFKREMGLLIGILKPGYGNTNDGNTARRFLANPEVSSRITGIDLNLISRFAVIVKTLSCHFKINSSRFG